MGESAAYADAFGRRERFGDEPPGPCPNSSGQGLFEPAPCSKAGGLVSLTAGGTAPEPLLSTITTGSAAAGPPPSVHRSSPRTPCEAVDSPASTNSLPSAWNAKGPCVDGWASVNMPSSSRMSQSTLTATSPSSSSSSSSSLLTSSPQSRASCFRRISFFFCSLVFLSSSAAR